MAGYRLADWRAGKLPDEGFVTRLLQEPGRSAAIATLQTGLGSELLLPPVLHMAFTDGALRHEFAQSCRRFLSERVLFHPGPPPQPLFSPAAIAVLCLPQPRTAADGGQVALRDAMRQLLAECCLPPLLWDQWLYRRMDGVSGWHIDEDLAALPWVAWRAGDPLPDMAAGADAPAYWPNLIALDL